MAFPENVLFFPVVALANLDRRGQLFPGEKSLPFFGNGDHPLLGLGESVDLTVFLRHPLVQIAVQLFRGKIIVKHLLPHLPLGLIALCKPVDVHFPAGLAFLFGLAQNHPHRLCRCQRFQNFL